MEYCLIDIIHFSILNLALGQIMMFHYLDIHLLHHEYVKAYQILNLYQNIHIKILNDHSDVVKYYAYADHKMQGISLEDNMKNFQIFLMLYIYNQEEQFSDHQVILLHDPSCKTLPVREDRQRMHLP